MCSDLTSVIAAYAKSFTKSLSHSRHDQSKVDGEKTSIVIQTNHNQKISVFDMMYRVCQLRH